VEARRLEPNPDVVWRTVDGEVVLVHLTTNRIYALNPTGARLWELLSEGRSGGDIEATLLAEFDVDAAELRLEIERVEGELVAEGLLRRPRAPSEG
jgi:coenzyme PQQ synthesis protein D (PqqD)